LPSLPEAILISSEREVRGKRLSGYYDWIKVTSAARVVRRRRNGTRVSGRKNNI
jgi:hypothetical protein